VLVESSG